VAIEPGEYALGPQTGKLTVRTGRRGAIAKAGHDLVIEVGAWNATLQIAPEPEQTVLELTADARSLRVLSGSGGVQSLGEDDKAGIARTIDEQVLKGSGIAFRSTDVRPGGSGRLQVAGDLELAGRVNPVAFDLSVTDDGRVSGTAIVKQTAWGIKPYTAMLGALKVADEVEVSVDAELRSVG
jgi:hypothetical protein